MVRLLLSCPFVLQFHSCDFQLKWRLDKTVGVRDSEVGLTTLRNKVKKGAIAATLVIQDSPSHADVTLNAGIKRAD